MDEELPAKKPRTPPHWLVVIVIAATGAFTVWAMSATRFKGPVAAWDRAHEVVDGVWGEEHPPAGAQPVAWAVPPAGDGNAIRQVAAVPTVPAIVAGVPATHADRGVCTNCHSMLAPQGGPIPSISSLSRMTHEFRGVCSNCHLLTIAAALPAARVAASPPGAAGPSEATWLGLEVASRAGGVTVQEAEGLGARRGVLANDVISSINGVAIKDMSDFVRVTQNGALAQGTLIVSRAGQRLAFELAPTTPPASLAQPSPSGPFGFAPSPPTPAAQEAQF